MKKTVLFLFLVFLNSYSHGQGCPTVTSGNGIQVYSNGSNLPASLACTTGDFLMRASLTTPFGDPIVPGVIIKFNSNANSSNWIQFLQNGSYWGCAGPPGNSCTYPITPNSFFQLQVYFMSPSVSNSFIFCENNTAEPNTPYTIEDAASGVILTSGTWLDDGACQTYTIPAGTISGVTAWSITSVPAGTPCPGCLGLTDQGYATFRPGAVAAAGGSGTWNLCYSFDPPDACPTYTYCQNITVTNPYVGAWTAPAAMCANNGTINLNSLLNGGSSAGGTWFGTGVSGNTFNPAGLNGTYAITYSLPCAVQVTHTITVKPIPIATATPSSQIFCSGGLASIALTSNVVGTTFSWTVVQTGVSGTSSGSGSSIAQTLNTTGSAGGTAVYTITPTANGCSGSPINVTITVDSYSTAPSSISVSQNPVCPSIATTLTQVGGSLGTGALYNWYLGSCGGPFIGSGSSIIVSPSVTTNYFVLASGTCNTTACATVTVTVNSSSIAPSSASVSPNPICAGISTTLTQNGGFLGTGAVYNWYSGSCAGTFEGAGSSISVTPLSSTTYFVRAQGTCNTTLCVPVSVTVNPVPFATASPSSQTICSGNTSSITLSSFTSGTTFSWTVVQSGVSGATLGSGASIAQTLTTTGTAPGTATYTVTPVANGCVGNPITVVITVNPLPVATATPASQTICSGGTSSIALTSNVSGTTYSWTVVQTGVSGASNASGSSIAETLTTTGAVAGTAVYTITPSVNACAGTPITITITVNPRPSAIATPSAQTFCSGSTTSIALTSTVSGTTFSWTVVQTGVSGGSIGTGTSIADILTTTSTSPGTAVYTITPSANSCAGNPITVTITVNPLDDASFSYSSATFCQSGINPSATITGLPGGLFSSTAGLVFLNTSTGLINLSASTLGTYTITYTTNGICPNTSSIVFTITGNPATGFSYTGSPYCQFGSNPSPTFVPGAFAGTFSASPAGLFFVNVNTGVIDLLTSIPGTYTIKNIILASGGCSADSATTSVTIVPTPVATATPSAQSICSGAATSIVLTSLLPGTTYAWTVVQTNVSGASAGNGSSIVQTLTATGTVSGTAIYTITPTVGTCTGAPIMDTVTVNINTVATATPTSATFCSGGTTSIVLSGNVGGTTFTWTASASGVSGALFGSGSTISQTLTTTGTSVGSVVYTITPSANGCQGNNIAVVVTVNPSDDASFTYTSATYCQSGTNQTPSITGLPGGVFSSSPAGLSINPSTGTINLSASLLGSYMLCYATNGTCPDTSCITMTIANTNPSASFSYSSASYCQNGINPLPVFVPGSSAGIYTAAPAGLVFAHVNTGEIDLSSSAPGIYTVINTIPVSGNCLSSLATTTVTITASDDASFTYTSATYCISGPNQTPTISGLPGGIFYASPAGLAIDSVTGTITLSTSVLGMYTLTYLTNGPCPNTSS
ncbi:MAG: PKD-like domain-containing protein, partial [Bacteroidota bacterium]